MLLVPVRRPFPHIAGHFIEAVAVWQERNRPALFPHSRLGREVLPRELALPGVRHWFPVGHEFVAPNVLGGGEAPARRKFPFGFTRQFLADPGCIGLRILERHMNNRMILQARYGAL